MIYMPPAMRANLYLSMLDTMDTSDTPSTREESQRQALAALVANYSSDDGAFALHEAFRLADALDYYLIDEGGDGPHSFLLSNVARLVGGERNFARAALRLLGANPTYAMEGDDWAIDTGSRCTSIRFPRDLLVQHIRAELEEAMTFADGRPSAA